MHTGQPLSVEGEAFSQVTGDASAAPALCPFPAQDLGCRNAACEVTKELHSVARGRGGGHGRWPWLWSQAARSEAELPLTESKGKAEQAKATWVAGWGMK